MRTSQRKSLYEVSDERRARISITSRLKIEAGRLRLETRWTGKSASSSCRHRRSRPSLSSPPPQAISPPPTQARSIPIDSGCSPTTWRKNLSIRTLLWVCILDGCIVSKVNLSKPGFIGVLTTHRGAEYLRLVRMPRDVPYARLVALQPPDNLSGQGIVY